MDLLGFLSLAVLLDWITPAQGRGDPLEKRVFFWDVPWLEVWFGRAF